MTPPVSPPEVGGIVLTGGGAARFGGADKASIELGGTTLLERSLQALAEVAEIVVVGDSVVTSRPVTFLREDPPGGGPAAGLLAGLAGFPRMPRLVVVLAVDMPLVTLATVRRLVLAADRDEKLDGNRDGALLVDDTGRQQLLCAAYRSEALVAAAPEDRHGLPVRRLVGDLRLARVTAVDGEDRDVDTWEDLRALHDLVED